jgi:hypothetical protein
MECVSSDSKNRAAAGFIQRFQNTAMCSTGLGASPQQAEKPFVPRKRNGWFFAFVHTDALLATTISVSSLPKCLAYLPLDYSAIFSIIKKKGEKT